MAARHFSLANIAQIRSFDCHNILTIWEKDYSNIGEHEVVVRITQLLTIPLKIFDDNLGIMVHVKRKDIRIE